MAFNLGLFNKSKFNVVISSSLSYTGIALFKCANWAEGPTHGGIQTEFTVDLMWDYISEYENLNGMTDYRKCFVKNAGELSTGSCIIRPALVVPDELVGRLSVTIAHGLESDNMTNKPADGNFGAGISTTIDPGVSIPIWLKRTITAGESPASSYLGLKFVLTISET